MTEKYFPQVGDNEVMLTEMPHMNLYDETDLISNITGEYVDKNYLEWQPIAQNTKPKHPYHQSLEEPLPKRRPVRKPDFKEPIDKKSPANRYAEEARERAREDLKKKRTAPYLTTDPSSTTANRKKLFISERKSTQPTAPFQKENPGELLKYSKRLRQDQLILANIEPAKEEEVVDPTDKKKNNYDFLKTSQIYNHDQKKLKPQPIKQELDLTHLDEE